MTSEEKRELLRTIGEYRLREDYAKCLDLISRVPREERDFELDARLSRCLRDFSVYGDRDPDYLSRCAVRSQKVLEKYRRDMEGDPAFYTRMGYALTATPGNREKALEYARRGREGQPGDRWARRVLLTARMLLARQRRENAERKRPLHLYTYRQEDRVRDHIFEKFGDAPTFIEDPDPREIRVDIYIVPPTPERDYYTFATLGAGAKRMNVPPQLMQEGIERAEYIICLPSWWKITEEDMEDDRWYWPISLLRSVAKLPADDGYWLGWGHTINLGEGQTYDDSVGFSGCVLLACGDFPGGNFCPLPSGDRVVFYQIVPLYPDEIEYLSRSGVSRLLDKFPEGELKFCDPSRTSAVKRKKGPRGKIFEDGERHLEKIKDKRLPVDPMNAYSHIAVYIGWAINSFLISSPFTYSNKKIVDAVRKHKKDFDLRAAVRYSSYIKGQLRSDFFSDRGLRFTEDYIDTFFSDVDNFACRSLGVSPGEEKSMKTEEYLFVPWDENYVRGLSEVIEGRYRMWLAEQGEGDRKAYRSPVYAHARISAILGCECTFQPRRGETNSLQGLYLSRLAKSGETGTIPFIVAINGRLTRTLSRNEPGYGEGGPDPEALMDRKVRELRKKVRDTGPGWRRFLSGKDLPRQEPVHTFRGFTDYFGDRSLPCTLALLPADDPVTKARRLPVGPGMPGREEWAAAGYFLKKYGALPRVLSRNLLEFYLPRPVTDPETARNAAVELMSLFPETSLDLEPGSAARLAGKLLGSTVWRLPFGE